jgi:hypothetical protein
LPNLPKWGSGQNHLLRNGKITGYLKNEMADIGLSQFLFCPLERGRRGFLLKKLTGNNGI